MPSRLLILFLSLFLFLPIPSRAREIPGAFTVDPARGDDAGDGLTHPFKTIARALKEAGPGDTVHLTPGRYSESAFFVNKKGEPGKPIVLDGHGAILDGSEALNPEDWESVSPGLFRTRKLPVINGATLARFFFLFDGKMQRMGRLSKGPSAELKQPEALEPGEWTFIPDEPFTRERKDGKPWDAVPAPGAFFVRIAPGKTLEESGIRYPARSNGVAYGGLCTHIVVKNLVATRFQNDGYNIHGDQVGLVFENIKAIECGDDGFSAHEAAECRIDGFVSIGNSTGLCDVGSSKTHYRNLHIRDCLSYDVFFISHGEHSIENALVESSAARAVSVGRDAAPEGTCAVTLRNVHIRRDPALPQEIRIGRGGSLRAERCTFEHLLIQATPGSQVDLRQCYVTGNPKPDLHVWQDVIWQGAGNHYDLKSLRIGPAFIARENFAEFQKLTGGETGSQWSPGPPAEGTGALPSAP